MKIEVRLSRSTPFEAFEILAILFYCLQRVGTSSKAFSPRQVYKRLSTLRQTSRSKYTAKILEVLLKHDGEALDAAFIRLGAHQVLFAKTVSGEIVYRVTPHGIEEVRNKIIGSIEEDALIGFIEVAQALVNPTTPIQP